MKKRGILKKGLSMLLAVAMVVGLMPNIGTMKVSAAETTSGTEITYTALDGNPEGYTNETYKYLLDGTADTKWCCSFNNPMYVIFKTSEPVYANGYSIWTGNDTASSSGRNPVVWTLYACNDYDEDSKSGGTWTAIHDVTNGNLPSANKTETKFTFSQTTQIYKYFKLSIRGIKSGNTMQLGDFKLTYEACDHDLVYQNQNVAATCTKGEFEIYKCQLCQSLIYKEVASPLGHDFVDEVCSRCNIIDTRPAKPNEINGVYQIGKASELIWFAGLVNGTLDGVERNRNANAVLTDDIIVNRDVLSSIGTINADNTFKEWEPIGNENYRYCGTFDGQNHTISGLYYNDADVNCVGLFGGAGTGSKISNLGVIDSYFCGHDYVGSVSGYIFGATIENCYSNSTVKGTQGVGGVCGNINSYGIMKNCYCTGQVSGGTAVGGVCGFNYKSVTNCYFDTAGCKNAIGKSSGTVTNVEGKTTEQFNNGEVCYLLNNGTTDGTQIWYQNIDNQASLDTYPTLDKSHGTVYQCTNCTGVYSNTDNIRAEHVYIIKTDDKKKHICKNCLEMEESHALSDLIYTADDVNDTITVTCSKCNGELGAVTLEVTEDTSGEMGIMVSNTVNCDGFIMSAVQYTKSDGTYLGSNAPTTPGIYTASITLGSGTGAATVSVIYAFGMPLPNIGTVSANTLYNTLDISQVELSRSDSTVSGTLSLKEGTTLKYGTHNYTYVFTPTGADADEYAPLEGTVSITINDTIAPKEAEVQVKTKKWNTFSNSDTIGTFFRNSQEIAINASDEASGVASIHYIVSDSPMDKSAVTSLSNGSWKTYSDTRRPSLPKGKHYVYVMVTDNAGNKTFTGTDCIIIYEDTVAASNEITYTYRENADKSVTLTLNGNTVESVTDKSGATLNAGIDYTLADDGTITFKASYLDTLSVSEIAYPITVSYKPQGETYVKDLDVNNKDLNDAPDAITINVLVGFAKGSVTDISDLSKTYDGKAVSAPTFTSTNDTATSIVTIEYKLASDEASAYVTTAPKNAGQYVVRVTVAADENYKEASAEKAFTISPRSVEGAVITLGDTLTYNGNEQTQNVDSVTVVDGDNRLSLNESEYDVTDATQTNAGDYTLTVTGMGNFTGSASKDFSIAKADVTPNKPGSTMNVDYSKKKVSDITTLPEDWTWKDADKDTALTVETPVVATAVYTGDDAGNYKVESVEISITREECPHVETELLNAVEANCTTKGYTGDVYCTECHTKITEGTEIAALGHNNEDTFTIDKAATCTEAGSKSKHCLRCDAKSEVTVIPVISHKWDAGKVTKAPTETAEGVKTYTCSVCHKTKTEAIPKKTSTTLKKGDVVVDDKASAKVIIANVKKKEVEYKEPVKKKAKTIIIPATVKIKGVTYKVTKIHDNAFKNNKNVNRITIGKNIKYIGKNVFYGCKKLKTIKVTSIKLTSKTVSKRAFKGLTKVTTIKVPRKKLSSYKKLFKKKGLSSKVKVKRY